MIIKFAIPSDSHKDRIIKFSIPIPITLAGSKLLWKLVPKRIRKFAPCVKDAVKALKQFRRHNGRWNIIDVYSPDGSHVVIRV